MFTFHGLDGQPVFSLTSTNDFLFAGGKGQVRAWRWEDLMNNQNIEPAFIIPVGNPRVKVNWLDVDHGDVNFGGRDKLLAGCGDNNVYVLNLERLNVVDVLRGHTSYVHCVAAANSAGVSVLSASEDGTVKFWDTRKPGSDAVFTCTPNNDEVTGRPKLGKFVSTVACHGDWMVCGGGPVTSLWNLSTRIMSGSIPPVTGVVYAAKIVDDKIYTSGQNTDLCVSNYGGELLSTVKLKCSCVYSLAHTSKHNLITVAGSSPHIQFINTENLNVVKSFSIQSVKS